MPGAVKQASAVEGVVTSTVFYLPGEGGIYQAYVEICWQIDPFSLHYRKNGQGALVARVQTDIAIRNDTGIVAEDHYILETDPAPPETASSRNILELKRLRIPSGNFRVELTLAEPEFPRGSFSHTEEIRIPVPAAAPFYSGIQLIDTLYPSGQQDHLFFRNGLVQIPRATNFIGEDRRLIRYYTELYRSDGVDTSLYPLVQSAGIFRRKDGGAVRHLQSSDTLVPGAVVPLNGQFDLSALASGNYYLNVYLHDRNRHELASGSYFFQLLNKNPVTEEIQKSEDTVTETTYLDIGSTFVSKFTPQQIKAILEMLLPGSDAWDRKAIEVFLKKPDELYMRYFVYNYFKKKNSSDPEKAWKEFAGVIREVNRMFKGASVPGFKTDRGQIYMKYGKPSDRVIVNGEPGALPYEIWQYYSLGKQDLEGIFLFYKAGASANDYTLLHSTVNGELRNPNWRSYLYSGGGNPGANSRAEQYLRNR